MFFWNAFWELSSDRHLGTSTGPIPFSSIDRYAGRYGIRHIDEFERFRLVMRAMDAAFLEKVPSGARGAVRADDVKGMKSLLGRLRAGAKARLQAATTGSKAP